MPVSSNKCDDSLLEHLLEDGLSQSQEEQLAEHLNSCSHCRERLETLAAEQGQWQQIGGVLKSEISGQHPSAEGGLSTLIPTALSRGGIQSRVGFGIQPEDFAVDFLKPSGKSDALGILNDIEIRAVIGHGGNGIVLKGFQEELARLVAVKVMAPQLAGSAAARKRFGREAQATAAIVHPSVMPVLTVHSDGQLPYLVMPYVDCESLQDRLDREGSLPVLDILRIACQVAGGLAAAHAQGLVHRDVKPANILLEKGVDRVMLTDFGLARAVDDATLTRTGLIAGTPQYMSPEQARGDAVDTRSDLFSLGSVIYAMCTGRPPFRAETSYGILRRVTDEQPRPVAELNPEIPDWLTGLTCRLMSKSADSRSENAEVLAKQLEDCIAHLQQPSVNALPREIRQLAAAQKTPGRSLDRLFAFTGNPVHVLPVLLLVLPLVVAAFSAFRDSGQDRTTPLNASLNSSGAESDDRKPTAVNSSGAEKSGERDSGSSPVTGSNPAEYVESDNSDTWSTDLGSQLDSLESELDWLLYVVEEQTEEQLPAFRKSVPSTIR